MYSSPTVGRIVIQNIEVVAAKDETLVAVKELQRRNRNRSTSIDLAVEPTSYRNDEPTDDVSPLISGHAPVDSLLDPMVGQRCVVQRTNETEQRVTGRNATPRSTVAGTAVRAA